MLVIALVCILYVHSSFAIILTRKRELVALLLVSLGCIFTVNTCILELFFKGPWVGLQIVVVVFPGHTYLLFKYQLVIAVVGNSLYSKVKSGNLQANWLQHKVTQTG